MDRLCKWIVEAISMAYEELDLPLPLVVSAHSSKRMAAPWALLPEVSLQEVGLFSSTLHCYASHGDVSPMRLE